MSSASSPTVPRPWRRHSGQAGGDAVSTPAQATEGQGPGQAAARGQKWSLPLVVTQICVSSRHMANLYLLQNFLGAAAKTIPPLPVPLPQPHGGHPALVLLSGMGAGLGGGAAALAGRQAPGPGNQVERDWKPRHRARTGRPTQDRNLGQELRDRFQIFPLKM